MLPHHLRTLYLEAASREAASHWVFAVAEHIRAERVIMRAVMLNGDFQFNCVFNNASTSLRLQL